MVLVPGGQDALDLLDVGGARGRAAGRRGFILVRRGVGRLGVEQGGQAEGERQGDEGEPARHDKVSFGHASDRVGGGGVDMRDSMRPKIIRPAGVCSTLVTVMVTSCPIAERPCSTTTIVPSSR